MSLEECTERFLMREAIRRVAVDATSALITSVRSGIPRAVFLTYPAVQEIEEHIIGVLERENGVVK